MAAEEFSNLSKAHRGVCCIDRIQTPTTASWHFTDMLIIAGFQTASEVCGLGPVALMKGEFSQECGDISWHSLFHHTELSCDISTSKSIILNLQNPDLTSSETSEAPKASSLGTSVLDLLSKPPAGQVVTFCKPLDDMLGGGVACGEITEFCMLTPLIVCSTTRIHSEYRRGTGCG